jgi:hypothetical protein
MLHLVGCNLELYYDAQTCEYQSCCFRLLLLTALHNDVVEPWTNTVSEAEKNVCLYLRVLLIMSQVTGK